MSETNWKWYVGYSEEEFTSGPYDTRDEAVQIARDEYEGGWIIEAHKSPLSLAAHFDVEDFLERAEEEVCEYSNPDGETIFDVTELQRNDLKLRVMQTIEQWQIDHNLKFEPWVFTGQRNLEFINGEVGDP